ncbi:MULTISPECIES: putative metalloprotease CJM1_0395 family protein [Pseudoalteromonas]|uniref:Catalase n=1 Tax=Pseudoalteromonas rubra TaxID=43658 RepID=A0A0U3HRG7_9GAMM|nr:MULTISPECIES: putative metalloprotease CJM1_0395 family protein [Pseudoalteromonas]ALU43897.1 catalase [Pseudoalteromonas rubra]MDK1314367.1 putative metalloprotease CJM1_0395 family protein [Pseudoalteromonas sp. R96]
MNIVTPPPAMNLNTANVYTETAQRDNQLREVIPKPAPVSPAFTENKPLSDGDKQKPLSADDSGLYDSTGQLKDGKTIEEREEGGQNSQGEQQDQQDSQELSDREQAELEVEQAQIQELKDRDREVRLHEEAHARVGGQYAGSPTYEYQRGPDGNNYAVGGQVMIDVAPTGDPRETIDKMQTVRAAALAPAEPSGADRAIAADATAKIAQAQADLAKQSISGDEDEDDSSNRVVGYQTRRLNEDEISEQQPESARLEEEVDPFAVALPIERDPEIASRALRIEGFYGDVARPKGASQLSVVI